MSLVLFNFVILIIIAVPGTHPQGNDENLCLREINDARKGLKSVTWDAGLAKAAKSHNEFMIGTPWGTPCFAYQCPGEDLVEIIINSGYHRRKGVNPGINVAAGYQNCKTLVAAFTSVGEYTKTQGILGNFENVGCSKMECDRLEYSPCWTCVLSTPEPQDPTTTTTTKPERTMNGWEAWQCSLHSYLCF